MTTLTGSTTNQQNNICKALVNDITLMYTGCTIPTRTHINDMVTVLTVADGNTITPWEKCNVISVIEYRLNNLN